jgi:osmoprotectant transport system ATP-binding protein
VIELDRVSRSYAGTPVVDNLSLVIPDGAFCMLIGPSGSGKSTTLRMINRLIEPTAGRILLDRQDTSEIPDLRLHIGYAIQSVGLFPHWSVAKNIAAVPRLLGWPRARREARVAELMRLVGLDAALAERRPHALSGGQQQRVGVARALAADPAVLLMDEPFGALDPPTRAGLQDEMRRIHAGTGKTIVFVTHDIEEALLLGTQIVVLRGGRLVQSGSPRDLLAAPADDFVRGFVGGGEAALRLLSIETVAARLAAGGAGAGPTAPGPPIAPDTTLREALDRMLAAGVDALPVAAGADTPAATLHLRDIFRSHAPPRG